MRINTNNVYIGQQIVAKVLAKTQSGDSVLRVGDSVAMLKGELVIGQDLSLIVTGIKDGIIFTKRATSQAEIALKTGIYEDMIGEMVREDIQLSDENLKVAKQIILETKMIKKLSDSIDKYVDIEKDLEVPIKDIILRVLNDESSKNKTDDANKGLHNSDVLAPKTAFAKQSSYTTEFSIFESLANRVGEKLASSILMSENDASEMMSSSITNEGASLGSADFKTSGGDIQNDTASNKTNGEKILNDEKSNNILETKENLSDKRLDEVSTNNLDNDNPEQSTSGKSAVPSSNSDLTKEDIAQISRWIKHEGNIKGLIDKFDLKNIIRLMKNEATMNIRNIFGSLKTSEDLANFVVEIAKKFSGKIKSDESSPTISELAKSFKKTVGESDISGSVILKELVRLPKELQSEIYYMPVPLKLENREEKVELFYKKNAKKLSDDRTVLVGLTTKNLGLVSCLVKYYPNGKRFELGFGFDDEKVMNIFEKNRTMIESMLKKIKVTNYHINFNSRAEVDEFFKPSEINKGFDIKI